MTTTTTSAVEVLRVSSHTSPTSLAGAIAGVLRDVGIVEIQAIGAGAVNQAVKACAIARLYLRDEGVDLTLQPSFIDVQLEAGERTAIRLFVERRPLTVR
jgi:stage V sporulation protein S